MAHPCVLLQHYERMCDLRWAGGGWRKTSSWVVKGQAIKGTTETERHRRGETLRDAQHARHKNIKLVDNGLQSENGPEG